MNVHRDRLGEVPLLATYRLQLTPSFDLDDSAGVVPYLAALGISHVYTSSYLQAAPGSTHGYDVVDPAAVNVELGGEPALARFRDALREHGLGNVIDVVPNHMAVGGPENRLWWDVLRHGRHSAAAAFFDIDWDSSDVAAADKVLLPVLGRSCAEELAAGAIRLVVGESGPEIHYGDHRFPIDPDSLDPGPDGPPELERFSDPAALDQLLGRQHYRLASWTIGRFELNYRRFFEVNTLAGVRVEDQRVFDTVHQRSLEWVRDGLVQGLRIDHPDGLRDPAGYLERLRSAAPEAWIVVEKILEPGESLPRDWPIDGTTGYDFAQHLTALFVDPSAEDAVTRTYETVTGNNEPYPVVLRRAKAYAVHELLATEVRRLVHLVAGILGRRGATHDHESLQAAVEAIVVATPVYRTYVAGGVAGDADAAVIAATIEEAKQAAPEIEPTLFDDLRGLWTGSDPDPQATEFVTRLQQLSGPAMAKGAEDTAFYRYNRLVALNEVGSDPSRFGIGIDEFHAAMIDTAVHRPLTMTATSTHDTKRSEDVRIRIAMLAEIPEQWHAAAVEWQEHNRAKWGDGEPDTGAELLLYQTLIGAHPLSTERAVDFAIKAMREAKQRTSWLEPNSDYEARLSTFVRAVVADGAFQQSLAAFVSPLTRPARLASLAQTLIKTTAPGIPDFYQGSELWTTSLVDPDNRTPVDYGIRRRVAEQGTGIGEIDLGYDMIGASKMAVMRAALTVRCDHPEMFIGPLAAYTPVPLTGRRHHAGVAFLRGDRVLTVAPIRPVEIDREGWDDTSLVLPAGRWTNVLDGSHHQGDDRRVGLTELTGCRALALLVRESPR